MNKIIISIIMLFAVTAFADVGVELPKGQCRTITICTPRVAHKKKKHITPPPVVVIPPPPKVIKEVVVVEKVVVKEVIKNKCAEPGSVGCKSELEPRLGIHVGIGAGLMPPNGSANIGLRFEIPRIHLGFEGFLAAPFGVGLQGMLYVYRGPILKIHALDVGFMVNFKECGSRYNPCEYNLSNQEFARRVDLLVGAGLQIKVGCHADLTLDWRLDIPDPVGLYNHRNSDVSYPYLDMDNVVKNVFGSSQLIFGFNIHD